MPDLEAWAIFAKVAETGSFARAAAELALSQPTVSKAMTRLEARLEDDAVPPHLAPHVADGEPARRRSDRAARILAEGEAVEAEVTRAVRDAARR